MDKILHQWGRSWHDGAPRIIIDTREQTPWRFPPEHPTIRAKLDYGDYSLEGYQHVFAIERKSFGDYVGSLIAGHDRFYRELDGAAASLKYFCVVVEACYSDVVNALYGTNAHPYSIMGMSNSIEVKKQIPVHFEGSGLRPDGSNRALWVRNNAMIAARRAYDILHFCWRHYENEIQCAGKEQ